MWRSSPTWPSTRRSDDYVPQPAILNAVIDVPTVVRNKAIVHGATQWLHDLPDLVADLERAWGIGTGAPYQDGTEAYVAPAIMDDGTAAVLKVLMPRDDEFSGHEITALRLADGRGMPRLYRSDAARHALLLEKLGRPLRDLGLRASRRHEILVRTAQQVWRPAPEGGLPTGAAKAAWLADFIALKWEQLNRPCSERAVEYALACARRRVTSHDDERAVLVHGDVHQWNTLEAGDRFKLVDPDGLLAEPEYDLGIIMREDPTDGDLRTRARWLAYLSGRDATAIWEWGAVERVSTGLLGVEVGFGEPAQQMLDAADHVAG